MTTSRATRALQLVNLGLQLALLVSELLNLLEQARNGVRGPVKDNGVRLLHRSEPVDESGETCSRFEERMENIHRTLDRTTASLGATEQLLDLIERRREESRRVFDRVVGHEPHGSASQGGAR